MAEDDEGRWRLFWREYRAQWGWRDVLAFPLVFLLTVTGTVALFGWELTADVWLGNLLISTLAWPLALRVVDRTVLRRYHRPGPPES